MITPTALAEATAALQAGTAVVVPNPAPLTCVVTATTPEAVNRAKGRPVDQPVALWITDDVRWAEFAALTDLDAPTLDFARALLLEEQLTLLLPVASVPPWVAPATRDGHALLFGTRWLPLAPLFTGIGTLHVSSANRTGQPPAATTAEARAAFPDPVHVLHDPDPAPGPRSATTTLRLARGGALTHTRSGAQDQGSPEAYVDFVREKFFLG
ncbi:Sua5/YciO/YrdC/YwlC family protein [Actinokineospora bangkokensis]|uniref:YrdC-like domain-containing protein n=1 Tax=Actinokineospora bangkokensis TaxID=1193682 RepID=A0A1Q9LN81_9PSEU|nr:Sua5/YciO/YrdC/YwlC family protein [Actinokineospora bangkokensis]OLR93506.1 hypothetical protein BJP25_14470 [Actinokineospora bangkokensis]